MSHNLYVEGGGGSKALRRACRRGFSRFLERAGLAGRMPRIVACGSREAALDDFRTSLGKGDRAVLLVDAEVPVRTRSPWQHLKHQDGWERPPDATDDHCHLMVQVMEAWFLADRDSLADFYGQGFNGNALPANPDIEKVPKGSVLQGLAKATRGTKKGRYGKGSDSFDLLARLRPDRVVDASPHARRLLDSLG